jgi:hypothetical protein
LSLAIILCLDGFLGVYYIQACSNALPDLPVLDSQQAASKAERTRGGYRWHHSTTGTAKFG